MSDVIIDENEEVWIDLPGHEGHIQASSRGRFRELRIIKQTLISNGYLRLHFSVGSERLQLSSHREICRAFNGPPPHSNSQTCHINGIRDDNRPSNLMWASPKVNNSHKVAHGTHNAGERHNFAVLKERDVMSIRSDAAAGVQPRVLARQYGVTRGYINDIVARRAWKHI